MQKGKLEAKAQTTKHPLPPDDITEEEFLKNYKPGDYERPSVTADILVFTLSKRGELSLLLIQRKNHPFRNHWALPGGFVEMDESVDTAARRELYEETNLTDVYMEQLATFGEVGRDPRMRVISVAYLGLAPKNSLAGRCQSGDDAEAAYLFQIKERMDGSFVFMNEEQVIMFSESELAFDHAKIVREGVNRIRGKLNYTDIGFELLENKMAFTMTDLREAYEAVSGSPYPPSNFTRNITTRYIKSGKMKETGKQIIAANGMKVAQYYYKKDGMPDTVHGNQNVRDGMGEKYQIADGNQNAVNENPDMDGKRNAADENPDADGKRNAANENLGMDGKRNSTDENPDADGKRNAANENPDMDGTRDTTNGSPEMDKKKECHKQKSGYGRKTECNK